MKLFNLIVLSFLCVHTYGQNYELVADINNDGSAFSFRSTPTDLIEFKGDLYFNANAPLHGKELFSFDGSTHKLQADIFPGNASGNPRNLIVFGGSLYFSALDGTSGDTASLFRYDGSSIPQVITSLYLNKGEYIDATIFEFAGDLYFTARDANTRNWQLMKYDGVNPPSVVTLSAPTSPWTQFKAIKVFNDVLYFHLTNSPQPFYQYDGTIASAAPGMGNISTVLNAATFNGKLYLYAGTLNTGEELFSYDGINAPLLVKDINPGSSSSAIGSFEIYNDELYFGAWNASNDYELFKMDKNESVELIDINPLGSSFPRYLCEYNNKLFFNARSASGVQHLFSYDGSNLDSITNAGASGYDYSPNVLTAYQGKLYFSAENILVANELHSFDGNEIALAANVYNGSNGSAIRQTIEFNDLLYLDAFDEVYGRELFVYDGTKVRLVADLAAGTQNGMPASSSPRNFFVFQNYLYFSASDGTSGQQLYRYNGTDKPVVVTEIPQGSAGFVIHKDELYFRGPVPVTSEIELMKFDGSNPAQVVANLNGNGDSYPYELTEFADKLYFVAFDDAYGEELWVLEADNSAKLVSDIFPGPRDSYPSGLTVFNNKLYFNAEPDTLAGYEMMVYDGTNPPRLAFDLYPGFDTKSQYPNSGYPYSLTEMDGKLYFIGVYDSTHVNQLFAYDESGAPVRVTSYFPSSTSSQFSGLKAIDNSLWFWADDGSGYGYELYTYDGLNAPVMIPELNVSGNSKPSMPSNFLKFKEHVYFAANDGIVGSFGSSELFRVKVSPGSTSINKHKAVAEPEIVIYPNPTSGLVNVQSDSEFDHIEIYSLAGELVGTRTTNQFSIQDLKRGLYLMKIYIGDQVFMKKVVRN